MFELMHGILGTHLIFGSALAVGVAYAAYWIAGLFFSGDDIEAPQFNNYPVQTSMKGGPIIKVYGTERVAGNVIWMGELHPYTVRHETGGGKGGGGGSGDVKETRYKRSFLLAICEGPAAVLNAWKGKTEISTSDFTWFSGDNNSGIRALTSEDYGDWPSLCCAFFDEYDLGNSEALPNFTFEVSSGTDLVGKTLIYDLAGLQAMNDDLNGDYVLMADIDATETQTWNGGLGFEPIGKGGGGDEFIGTLNGRNHTIDGLFIDRTGAATGLFSYLGRNGVAGGHVSNLKLTNCNISGVSQVGMMVGVSNEGSTCADCYVQGTIYGKGHHVGGFVGRCYDDSFTRCAAVGAITMYPTNDRSNYGGFYGLADSEATFTDCYARCTIAGGVSGGVNTGGFGGTDDENNTITRCYAAASIQYSNSEYGYYNPTRPNSYLGGGFVGYANNPGTYTSCYWDTEEGASIYPDAAQYDSGYKNERQRHDIDADPTDGHFHISHDGNTTGEIAWDANEAAVQAACDATFGAGEFDIEFASDDKWDNNSLLKVMFKGSTYGQSPQADLTFDLTAMVPGGMSVVSSDDVTGVAPLSDANITGKTTAQMQTQGTFIGWDFDTVWYMGDSGYPELRMQRLSGYDMNPADIIRDIIEDMRYGAGRTAIIDDTSLDAAGDIWDAMDFRLSIKLDSQRPWPDWVDYILAQVSGYRFNSGGKLHFGVLGDDAAVDNITADDFVRKGTDPAVDITKRTRADTVNRLIIGWTNRDKRYELDYVTAEDRVDQRRFGVREKIIKLVGIHNIGHTRQIAYRLLIDGMYRFNIYKFRLTFSKLLLDKGDVITLTDGELLDARRVRIMNIDEAENCRDRVITAMDDLAVHYPDITGYQSQENLYTPDPAVTLADAAVNFREDVNTNNIYLSVVPGSAYFNGALIYRSYDDVSYDLVGRMGVDGITGGDANSAGTITESLPAHGSSTWAKDESVLVSIGTVTDLKTSISEDQFWHDQYLARIGDEIIAFKTAEETATAGIWRISNLRRGLFGTEPAAHSASETFCTLDPNFTYSFAAVDIGQTIYFKAVVFYGDNYQDISDLSGYPVTVEGHYKRPAAASLLRLESDQNEGGSNEYSGPSFSLYWNLGSRVSGWNYGGWDVSGGGVPWNNYTADDDLEAIVLKFEQTDGTPIGQREIAVAEIATITKATDLGGLNDAVVRVVPRRVYESRLENKLEVTSI